MFEQENYCLQYLVLIMSNSSLGNVLVCVMVLVIGLFMLYNLVNGKFH